VGGKAEKRQDVDAKKCSWQLAVGINR